MSPLPAVQATFWLTPDFVFPTLTATESELFLIHFADGPGTAGWSLGVGSV
jgi:hypothetical protein